MKKLILTLLAALVLGMTSAWAGGGHGGHRHGGPALHGGHGFHSHHKLHGHRGFHARHGLPAHRGFHGHHSFHPHGHHHKFHGHHGFHGHRHKFHSHLALGVIVAPSYWWAPGYYSPPVYYPPTTVYAEPDPAQYWYYCTNPQGYYPYVTDCPSGWLQVVPRGPAR